MTSETDSPPDNTTNMTISECTDTTQPFCNAVVILRHIQPAKGCARQI